MRYKAVTVAAAALVGSAISANAVGFLAGSTLAYAGVGVINPAGTMIGLAGLAANLADSLDLAPVGTPITVTPLLDSTAPAPTPGTPLLVWSEGLYSFSATSALVITGPNGLTWALNTSGFVDDGAGGLDPTPATFTLAITPSVGPIGGYAAITTVVPEPSTYAVLAGLGLIGFAGYRRFRS